MTEAKLGEQQQDIGGVLVDGVEEFECGEATWALSLSPDLIEDVAEQIGEDVATTAAILNDHLILFLSDAVRDAVEGFLFEVERDKSRRDS
jgi:hypothetical protein